MADFDQTTTQETPSDTKKQREEAKASEETPFMQKMQDLGKSTQSTIKELSSRKDVQIGVTLVGGIAIGAAAVAAAPAGGLAATATAIVAGAKKLRFW